jgi:hypothetical protein
MGALSRLDPVDSFGRRADRSRLVRPDAAARPPGSNRGRADGLSVTRFRGRITRPIGSGRLRPGGQCPARRIGVNSRILFRSLGTVERYPSPLRRTGRHPAGSAAGAGKDGPCRPKSDVLPSAPNLPHRRPHAGGAGVVLVAAPDGPLWRLRRTFGGQHAAGIGTCPNSQRPPGRKVRRIGAIPREPALKPPRPSRTPPGERCTPVGRRRADRPTVRWLSLRSWHVQNAKSGACGGGTGLPSSISTQPPTEGCSVAPG